MKLDPEAMSFLDSVHRVGVLDLAFVLLILGELCARVGRLQLQRPSQAWHPLSLELSLLV